jgi:hypothetical protein
MDFNPPSTMQMELAFVLLDGLLTDLRQVHFSLQPQASTMRAILKLAQWNVFLYSPGRVVLALRGPRNEGKLLSSVSLWCKNTSTFAVENQSR